GLECWSCRFPFGANMSGAWGCRDGVGWSRVPGCCGPVTQSLWPTPWRILAAEKGSAIALAPAVQAPGAGRLGEFLGPEAAKFIDEQIKSTIPLGGALGDPADDLGPTLVFLCSTGSRFITGQLIAGDGGLVMLGS